MKTGAFLLLIVLSITGFVGCGKTEKDSLKTTPIKSIVTTVSIVPEKELTVVPTQTSTVTPMQQITITPSDIPTLESVVFPVEINEITFPEQLLRTKAMAADSNEDSILSEEEAQAVTKLHLKKLMDDSDDLEEESVPQYTIEDFTFDLEGIQYFTELSELTVNLLGGERFALASTEEIFVTTKHFERLYACTNLKKLSLYEIGIDSLELSAFPNLKRLELNFMYNLERLQCGNHKKLATLWVSDCHNLKTIDVSELENLKTVDIVWNDGLTELYFGKANQKVETLQLNSLKSLYEVDLSDLVNLKSLNLMDIALKNLDISKNVELEQFCAEELQLGILDLRNNPKVSYLINAGDSFREILLPEDNCISMIRWTNSAVTEFSVKNLNPDILVGIDIQETAIKELDVRDYPNLEYLYYNEDVTKILR